MKSYRYPIGLLSMNYHETRQVNGGPIGDKNESMVHEEEIDHSPGDGHGKSPIYDTAEHRLELLIVLFRLIINFMTHMHDMVTMCNI